MLVPELCELPGQCFSTHPIAEVVVTVPSYTCTWRKEYKARVHINVAEMEAYLCEEARLAGSTQSKRALFGLDSQVCLGALCKGRSASPVLNHMLAASLGPMLGSRIFPHFMHFPSALNPADDPARDRPVRSPSRLPPAWWTSLQEGPHVAFDEWLSKAEAGHAPKFSQEQLYELGGQRSIVLRPNRERAVCASARATSDAEPSSLQDRPATKPSRASPWCLLEEVQLLLKIFPQFQFVSLTRNPDLSQPGALDLFTGKGGVARSLVKHGAPWVLTSEIERGADQDLNQGPLRDRLVRLLSLGAFKALGAAPVCASFSRAVRPPVRSRVFPQGLSGISPQMFQKVQIGNMQKRLDPQAGESGASPVSRILG